MLNSQTKTDRPGVAAGFELLVPDPEMQAGIRGLPVPPHGCTFLHRCVGGRPRLARQVPRISGRYAVEPWYKPGGAPVLILAAPAEPRRAWINGARALPLSILHEGDEILLDYLTGPLFVARFLTPRVGTPPPEDVGSTCPVCRSPVLATTRVYVCPCGALLHAEEADMGADRLACREAVDACPVCRQDILLKPGYSQFPNWS